MASLGRDTPCDGLRAWGWRWSQLVTLLQELPEAPGPAGEERFGLEVEADAAGRAVEERRGVGGQMGDDFEVRLGGFVALAILVAHRHVAAATPAEGGRGQRALFAGDDLPAIDAQALGHVAGEAHFRRRKLAREDGIGV